MSGTRFARTGRCRFLAMFLFLLVMVLMVFVFHSSQMQLDETREQRLHCEQQQEALNERLTSLVEQKFNLEKNLEHERKECLETKRNLEMKFKDVEEKHQKEQVETQMRYDKLQQAHKLLQNKHKELQDENLKANKEHSVNINGLESKLQSLKSELKKEKSNKSGEVYLWKEKYNTVEQEKARLESLFSDPETKQQLEHIKKLENQLVDCKSHCNTTEEISKQLVAPKPDISGNGNPSTSQKTFRLQEPIVPKPIKRIVEEETQIDQQPAESAKQQVAPLGAPEHKSSTTTFKSEQQMPAASALNANTRNAHGNNSSSTSNSPPLALPPGQRKLPANVAPFPENFEDLLQKSNNEQSKNADAEFNKNDENHLKALSQNHNDFGAHEEKDNINDDSNLPRDEDVNNFFDTDNDAPKDHRKQNDAVNNDDDDAGLLGANENDGEDDGVAAGDIAVKQNQQQLEQNLKNEIDADQGKEFDGLRLDEGAMEEDDDDDYSNPSARKKADKAIRH